MDLSMRWLADYVDCKCDTKKFCDEMTLSGSKVECFGEEGDYLSNVVVGHVVDIVPHPNSDHMFICQIDVGEDAPVQIVTGAQNVKKGDYVPAAKHKSTVLHEGKPVKITKGKLRGEPSNGMLCSLEELGLTLHDFPYAIEDGIFILGDDCDKTVGMDIKKAIGFDDTIVEFEITSNRPDCLSVTGLAREAAATFNVPVNIKEPTFKGVDGDINEIMSVEIHNADLCPRYMAGYVKNVKIGPSPRWLRERLRASGVRPINNFVDITNFVMLEYGQPMHAFDLRYVSGAKINIRNAKAGEKITTLDGQERELSEEMLVIADAEKPVAVAGVMGGEYSGIMDDTTAVVFESACFDGASVRTTAKKLGMRTDASARFEKGLDPENTYYALLRAFELVEELGCGEVVRTYIDCDKTVKKDKGVTFDPDWINGFLGTDIPAAQQEEYLTRLGFEIKDGKAYAPYYRIDIECKSDLAEEVARLYGYNNIPDTIIRGVAQAKLTRKQRFERTVTNAMLGMGVNEITTFSFISPKYFDKIRLPQDSKLRNTVVISNPLGEDTSVMRTTILPSVMEVLARNYSFRNQECYAFELGSEYLPVEGEVLPTEPERLGIGLYDSNGKLDFYTIKGMIEELFDKCGAPAYEVARPTENCTFGEVSAFHPGRVAVITAEGKELAIFGELHPETCENYGIGCRAYAAKVNIPELMELCAEQKTYKPLPKFPAATRDLSLICDDELPAAVIEKTIRDAAGSILESVTLFDIYKGQQIAEGKKSISYSLTLRSHEGTLTDDQADKTMDKVIKALAAEGAELRM
ncbi:phenylalanyl-tRNA synthetase beta subunit [Ruminococcus sp. YE71]|uniref:phenylalanine--tRNA ligase subunit beta n=1 Tax=unclassified Ruminococcus TaxID=2608920 RepID=UPI00087F5F1A|nr:MULTISPECIES: phenylalanine--tRNA ligase subunit beta [unclassified Ruminococcus]SDA20787.1 phenylalanyl-tRNA synthetase beta subunit [Ruminococcus sp. YE78]SFW33631.1 phenylalanyl-tRNA synthetase beta subunit [Ruminococcus sp. YE71]